MKIAIEEMGFFGDVLLDTAYFKKIKQAYTNSQIDLYYYHDDQKNILKNSPYIDNFIKWPNGVQNYRSVEINYDRYLAIIGSLSWSYFNKNLHLFDYRKTYFLNLEANLSDINVHWDKDDIVSDDYLSSFKYPVVFSAPGPKPPPLSGKNLKAETWIEIFEMNPDIDFIQIGTSNTDYNFVNVSNVTSLLDKLSITESISILRLCKFAMGCDSLINHASILYNTPAIICFGSTAPVNYGYEKNINIFHKKECSPCASKVDGLCCMADGIDNISSHEIQEKINILKSKIL